jgi:hypothetical protein
MSILFFGLIIVSHFNTTLYNLLLNKGFTKGYLLENGFVGSVKNRSIFYLINFDL